MDLRGLGTLLLAVILLAGCPSNEPELAPAGSTGATGPSASEPLLSSVHVADPRATPQLLEGFYSLEQGAWRWTAKRFSVALLIPEGAGEGTQLEFNFTLPEAVLQRLHAVTLSARVNGVEVGSETYQQPGEFVFSKPVPAAALQGQAAKVEFELDKALPPGEGDQRELGIVAVSVALK